MVGTTCWRIFRLKVCRQKVSRRKADEGELLEQGRYGFGLYEGESC